MAAQWLPAGAIGKKRKTARAHAGRQAKLVVNSATHIATAYCVGQSLLCGAGRRARTVVLGKKKKNARSAGSYTIGM